MKIELELEEYISLKQKEEELNLLESGGVDNWLHYGDALNPGDEVFDDIMENIEKSIREKYKKENANG